VGQVVSTDGQPNAAVPVSLQYHGHEVAVVRTDETGYFAIKDVRGGLYTLQAPHATANYRVWNSSAAPPAASPAALLVTDNSVVRGQGIAGTLNKPIVIGAIIATAIAVPVAISNFDSGS